MTTNVNISTNYVHPGKVLRARSVDPKSGAVYGEQSATQRDVEERGVDQGNGVKSLKFDTMYVHDGSRLIVEEAEPEAVPVVDTPAG